MAISLDSRNMEEIYDEIVRYDRTKRAGAFAEIPGFSAFCLWASLGFFVLSVILVGLHESYPDRAVIGGAAFASLFAGYVALLFGLSVLAFRSLIPQLRHPARIILSRASTAQTDFQLATRLAVYDEATLQFVALRLRQDAAVVRLRARLWAGAVESFGLLPALAGALFAAALVAPRLAHHTIPVPSRLLALGSATLAATYLWGLMLVPTGNRIEELAQVVEFALAARKARQGTGAGPRATP
jgi:hypothetical protein